MQTFQVRAGIYHAISTNAGNCGLFWACPRCVSPAS
jgi:hypothetical protein